MRAKTFVKIWLHNWLYPRKSLDYFNHYYAWVEQITVYRNPTCILLANLFNILLFVVIVRFIYMAFGCATCGQHPGIITPWHAIHFDMFYAMALRPIINLIVMNCAIMILYLNYWLCQKPNFGLLVLLRELMIRENWQSFFLVPKWNSKQACAMMRSRFVHLANFFQSVEITILFIVPYNWLFYMQVFYQNLDYYLSKSVYYLAFCMLMNHFGMLLLFFFFFGYTYLTTVNFSTLATLLFAIFTKMKQTYRVLHNLCYKEFDLRTYIVYKREFQNALKILFATNKMYGKLFLAVLLAMCPINVFSTALLLEGKQTSATNMILYAWIVYFSLFIFAVHLGLAFCIKHIHRPKKPLMHLLATRQDNPAIHKRTRINLLLQLFAFHTPNKRRYGFTYGSFGLVTLMNFTKYMLIYGEYIMSTYDLMRQKRV